MHSGDYASCVQNSGVASLQSRNVCGHGPLCSIPGIAWSETIWVCSDATADRIRMASIAGLALHCGRSTVCVSIP